MSQVGVGMAEIEKRLSGVREDFTQALQRVGETENEKFDLIFAILVELQSRQAQLEESVRTLSQHLGFAVASGCGGCGGCGGASGGGGSCASGGCCTGGWSAPGPSQGMFGGVQQVVVVASPSANGVQYAMPQMMFPNGHGAMQPMAMQYMGQGQGASMGSFVGSQGDGTPSGDQRQQQQQQQLPQGLPLQRLPQKQQPQLPQPEESGAHDEEIPRPPDVPEVPALSAAAPAPAERRPLEEQKEGKERSADDGAGAGAEKAPAAEAVASDETLVDTPPRAASK
eukprot:CAMPEP_0177470264 /NCGR_PEP_ID=MMETSP0369-20130122/20106_1 /TAXON_ID=447022 ORGANISM="Scrippsiella hangoei-like, Strain SHHI-4" /NCGR_SAMPLE_ID=MMETSP0369 /ASSEMBLY_ACC=CAM_ASM_000364 /LENGTH=282 /DNA_ID=CAMNT_0018944707 /DNA_START=43 /DNA_END=891 /DNA_ORIENTATION=-